MMGCKPAETFIDSTVKLGINEHSASMDKGCYQWLVANLIYLFHTRPNIGFLVSVVSQFMNHPTKEHMKAIYRILRYLKMTPKKGLYFSKNSNQKIEVISNVDWARFITNSRLTTRYYTFM